MRGSQGTTATSAARGWRSSHCQVRRVISGREDALKRTSEARGRAQSEECHEQEGRALRARAPGRHGSGGEGARNLGCGDAGGRAVGRAGLSQGFARLDAKGVDYAQKLKDERSQ